MDTLSHALWGRGVFGYRGYPLSSIFFGILPDLFSFLTSNNYDVNTRLTKILKREETGGRDTIAFVSYEE